VIIASRTRFVASELHKFVVRRVVRMCVAMQTEIQTTPRDSLIDLTAMKDSSLDDVCLQCFRSAVSAHNLSVSRSFCGVKS